MNDFPKCPKTRFIDDRGIRLVEEIVQDHMGHVWRINTKDFGIDGYIEIRAPISGEVSNKQVGVQVKTCSKKLAQEDQKVRHYIENRHLNYWKNGTIAVIFIICYPANKEAYWIPTDNIEIVEGKPGTTVTLDRENDRFDTHSSDAITALAFRQTIPTMKMRNNLPRRPPFFGRRPDIAKAIKSLGGSSSWGCLIFGPRGIGKTDLAIKAARDSSSKFERILFLASKSSQGQSISGPFILSDYLEMLNSIARELGHEAIPRSPTNERAKLVLHALSDSKTLLVLDNLDTLPPEDLESLLGFLDHLPPDCNAITTMVTHPPTARALSVKLVRLKREIVFRIMRYNFSQFPHIKSPTTSDCATLFKATGSNLLLVNIIIKKIGIGEIQTISAAVEFLRAASAGEHLEYLYGEQLGRLSDVQRGILVFLALFMSPVRLPALAALSQSPTGLVAEICRGFEDNLLAHEVSENAYLIFPLVFSIIHKRWPQEISDASNRLKAHVISLVAFNGFYKHQNFTAIEDGWNEIATALPSFLTGENGILQQLCDGLQRFLETTGRWDEWLTLSIKAEKIATDAGDLREAGWRAHDQGCIHYERGEVVETLACAERCTLLWNAAGSQADFREKAFAAKLRGIAYRLANKLEASIGCCQIAVSIWRANFKSIQEEGIAFLSGSLNSLAETERLALHREQAKLHFDEALELARSIEGDQRIAKITGNLAQLAIDQRDWNTAQKLATTALELSERTEHRELIASNSLRLSNALIEQNLAQRALPLIQRAQALFKTLNSVKSIESEKLRIRCEHLLKTSSLEKPDREALLNNGD